MKKTSPENKIKEYFGESINNIGFTKLDVDCNPKIGNENETNNISCLEYIHGCFDFYPTLLKFYNEKLSKEKNKSNIEIADEIFVPTWNNIHFDMNLKYPISFDGDHRSEDLHRKLNIYSTRQAFAKYTNSNVCAALSTKFKFNSKEDDSRELSFMSSSEINIGKNEFSYLVERNIEPNIDNNIISNNIRYLTAFKRSKDLGVFIVCGSQDFLMGEDTIFTKIEEIVSEMRKYNVNEQYKGIHLSKNSITSIADSDPNVELSLVLSRLLSGCVLLHDYLMILKNIYNVKHLLEFDISKSYNLEKVEIDTVINKYKSIKKYLTMALSFNQIT